VTFRAVNVLGVDVHAVTYDQVLDQIGRWIRSGESHQIATVNPEFVMAARTDPAFRHALEKADLRVADGIGLLWAARLLGDRLPERVTGSDLVPLIARAGAVQGWTLFLLGAAPGVAERTAAILTERYPGIGVAGTYGGSPADVEAAGIVQRIRQAAPDVLLVAYGAPHQDVWIARHGHDLEVPVMMGVGGAFDHVAGLRRRAPGWVQRIHLEWLFRLVTQPWRWRRQLALPRFALAVVGQRLREG
jgi:N-acetylglucosaminyldiphosphoundecaprenol N-acetyl-beta-D-mannosaminyltransferase